MGLQVDTAACITGLLYTHAKAAGSYLSASRGVTQDGGSSICRDTEGKHGQTSTQRHVALATVYSRAQSPLLHATLARLWLNFERLLQEAHKMLPNLPFTHQAESAF